MVTDHDLALACEATYGVVPQTWGTDVIHVYLTFVNGTAVVAFEGTTDTTEWLIDFDAIPVDTATFSHADLGLVHQGWWNDVASVADPIIANLALLKCPLACTGHSKGAAEALIFAAYAITKGIKWDRVSTFGTPHPGYLNGLLKGVPGNDYKNTTEPADPVPDVPFFLPRPRGITLVQAPTPQYVDAGPSQFTSHHIQNYVAAMAGG